MEKLILQPITNEYHHKYSEYPKWYSVINITSAEIALIREESAGDSYIDLEGIVIGFISYEDSVKHNISTGKLLPYCKIQNKTYHNKLLQKDLSFIKTDIVYAYPKEKIDIRYAKHIYIGDKVKERIPYTEDISKILIEINKDIFNIKYTPYTCCNRLSDDIEMLMNKISTFATIIKTQNYIVKKNGLVLSNVELNNIQIENQTIQLSYKYSNITGNSLPNCYIYEFNKNTMLPIHLFEALYQIS
jgi:hypothetical protein